MRRLYPRVMCPLSILSIFISIIAFSIPERSVAQSVNSGSAGATSFVVQGVTVYDAATLVGFAREHVARHDGVATPARIAEAIELIYREDGYLLAEVEFFSSGEAQPQVLIVREGRIDTISIEGVDEALFAKIRQYFDPVVAASPLHWHVLERAVMLTDDLAGVYVTTEIDFPDPAAGARLRVLADQTKSTGSITIDNWPRNIDPALSLYVDQEFYSTLIPGDRLRLEVGGTHFFGDSVDESFSAFGSAIYVAPVGSDGTFLEGYIGNAYTERATSGGFVATDFRGFSAAVAAGHPFIRDVHTYGYGLIEARYSTSGADTIGIETESDAAVAGIAAVFGHTFQNDGTLEVTASLSVGANAGDNPAGVRDGDDAFWHFRLNAGFVEPLDFIDTHTALSISLAGQATTSDLPAIESFYLGDRDILRGYEFGEAAGDVGFAGAIEISRLFRSELSLINSITPNVFVDFGYARFNRPQPGLPRDTGLVSAGVGLRSQLGSNLSVSGFVASPLRDGPSKETNEPFVFGSISYTW